MRVGTKDFENIIGMIVQDKAELLEDNVLRKVYKLTYKNKLCKVVYDIIKRRVITFLPLEGSNEWVDYETRKKGSPFGRNLPPYIPLDTDFVPEKR
jgi:hypothetical protein